MAGEVDRLTAMIETPLNTKHLERRFTFVQTVLIVLLVIVIAAPFVASWWLRRNLPVVSTLRIENVQLRSPAALCPGEELIFSYHFHAEGAGVLVRDFSLWQTKPPPRTLIYSDFPRRFILDGPIDQTLTEVWAIPESYFDYTTGQTEPLVPGLYRRFMSISSPSRSTAVAIVYVEFTVRSDCGN